jgi:hypothetical protein
LDGTLAKYDHWRGLSHIGEPIPAMVARVREWLAQGLEVRIMTARMDSRRDPMAIEETREAVAAWTFKHLGVPLACTNTKDFDMVEPLGRPRTTGRVQHRPRTSGPTK